MLEAQLISINVSTLTFRSYQYLGSDLWFWKVEIDGALFSETMHPVLVSDSRIERFGCTECGVYGCGDGFYAVRRLGNRVLWIHEELLNPGLISYENLPGSYVFDCDEYEKVIGAGSMEDLPELKLAEIRMFLQHTIPPAALALYMSPETRDDLRGSKLLASVKQKLEEDWAIAQIQGCPERLTSLTIGLDLPGAAECKWLVGVYGTGLCVMFVEFPALPCWLYGESINAAFDFPSIRDLLSKS